MHTENIQQLLDSLHLLDKTQTQEERDPAGVCHLKSALSTQLYDILSLIEGACWSDTLT